MSAVMDPNGRAAASAATPESTWFNFDFEHCFACRSNVLLVFALGFLILAAVLMVCWYMAERMFPSSPWKKDVEEEFMIAFKDKCDKELGMWETRDIVIPMKTTSIDDD